ncbi:hypothetical protein [Streptomyces gilvosporeus]|uniref:hypothetical protein n=1 Tax=Streptomyces gilvosporeus TaxID=553510 RepID=UPI001F2541CE|nr:hypothetical protein [Streptomyces gilvosporeus]
MLVPVLAALAATVWSTWTQRNSRKSGDGAELAGYARFREAMEREHSASDPASDVA